ncbi:MAG: family 1 glycosylhydrolase [Bacteroidota bacterium]
MKITFPSTFKWGTSTAAAQIETASDHNWRGLESKDGYIFDRTIDHELHREEDIEYIKQFGTIYRCGVDWARLQPGPFAPFNEDVVAEYQTFFTQLHLADMEIMFVLHHFTNPMWFEEKGGWLNSENIPLFLDYSKKCIKHFGRYVNYWNTFNEPGVYALNGYISGNFPPHKKNIFQASRVIKNMGRAHEITVDLLREFDDELPIGISKNTCYFIGLNFIGKLFAGFTDWWFMRFVTKHFGKLDFLGISYYAYIPFKPGPITEIDMPGELAKMGIRNDRMWGFYPQGLTEILQRFYKKYQYPIMITENGVCTHDDQFRQQALREYLKACYDAMEAGVDLRGYIYWSTFDNFEWNLGPTFRFGLVEVDMETMERKMTDCGLLYKQTTETNEITYTFV